MIAQSLGWVGTLLFFYGVMALSLKHISGFYANGMANILYTIQGSIMFNYPLVVCSIGLLLINIYGIYNWRNNDYIILRR